MSSRIITWDGFHNARDLGGLPTQDGQATRFGQLIRSANVHLVTTAGWRAAYAAGVRTVLDLRSEPEVIDHVPWGDDGPVRIWLELDPWNNSEYWQRVAAQGINGTPLTFDPFLTARALLDGFDARRYLLEAGVSEADLRTVQARLLGG